MLIGYMRVSKADGSQVLDLQRDALLGAGIPADRLYEDHASGKRDDRPGLDACLKALRKDDTLVAWKLDRLGRDLRHLVNLVHDLTGRGVGLKVLAGQGANLDTTTANGRLVFGIFAALAEFERELIVERTRAGLASARARGRNGGRPFKMTSAKLRLAQAAMGQPGTKVAELCLELGVSRQTLYRHVDPKGALRPDGERLLWQQGTVGPGASCCAADGSRSGIVKATLCHAALAAALIFTCLAGPQKAAAQAALPADVAEEPTQLDVTINGKAYVLDALVVRLPGDDRLPVALVTHGANPGNPRGADLDWLRVWAHELAHRGWLAVAVMRRGYGRSEGEVADDAGTCASPDVGRYLDAHADDLEAALRSVAHRPDADMSHVLAIGDSAGGAAVMALAARATIPLAAVVNVSGGLGRHPGPFRSYPDCTAFESDLVWNLARFGTTARMPTLWLYAENDSWFRPGLVSRMRAAFTGSGGRADLVMLPPFRDDGHAMFFGPGGRELLLPELDRFLRANGLPTWNEAAFAPLLARLPLRDRQGVETYLQLPAEKALALAPPGGVYWSQSRPTGDDARAEALAYCKQQVGADCTLAVVNFHPVDQATQHAATDR